jgi:DNA-binding NarL/FixJ family response regulator
VREEKAITVASVSSFAYSEEAEAPAGPRPALRLARVDEEPERSADRDIEVAHFAQRSGLTLRDIAVLGYLAQGWTTSEIAHELVYAESTIKKEVHFIVHRLGARNRTHAVALAIRESVI